MALAIDGYNLLHATMPPSLAGLDEMRLCRLLANGPWRGRIVVVCDGQPKPHAPCSPVPEVELIYSGGATADDVIIKIVELDHAPRQLVVVSSDRQIQKAARRRRCRVIDSDRFVSILAALPPGSAPVGKPAGATSGSLPEDDVRRWLREFGFDDEADADANTNATDKAEDDADTWWRLME